MPPAASYNEALGRAILGCTCDHGPRYIDNGQMNDFLGMRLLAQALKEGELLDTGSITVMSCWEWSHTFTGKTKQRIWTGWFAGAGITGTGLT